MHANMGRLVAWMVTALWLLGGWGARPEASEPAPTANNGATAGVKLCQLCSPAPLQYRLARGPWLHYQLGLQTATLPIEIKGAAAQTELVIPGYGRLESKQPSQFKVGVGKTHALELAVERGSLQYALDTKIALHVRSRAGGGEVLARLAPPKGGEARGTVKETRSGSGAGVVDNAKGVITLGDGVSEQGDLNFVNLAGELLVQTADSERALATGQRLSLGTTAQASATASAGTASESAANGHAAASGNESATGGNAGGATADEAAAGIAADDSNDAASDERPAVSGWRFTRGS